MKSSTSFTCNDCCFGYCSPFDFQDSAIIWYPKSPSKITKETELAIECPSQKHVVGGLPSLRNDPCSGRVQYDSLSYQSLSKTQLPRVCRDSTPEILPWYVLGIGQFQIVSDSFHPSLRKTTITAIHPRVNGPTNHFVTSTRIHPFVAYWSKFPGKKTTRRNLFFEHSPNWDHTKNIAKGKFIGWKKWIKWV